jgi:mono/diheme cytochrome c family protein
MRKLGESCHRWRPILAVLAVFAALGFVAGRSGAQNEDSIAFGRLTYRVYCQNCHGNMGKGDGRIAELMKVKPSDLTQISKKNGGTFPTDRLQRIVDGREDVAAHGDREMPIWGQVFLDSAGNEETGRAKIQQLMAYLESIQEKGAAKK